MLLLLADERAMLLPLIFMVIITVTLLPHYYGAVVCHTRNFFGRWLLAIYAMALRYCHYATLIYGY